MQVEHLNMVALAELKEVMEDDFALLIETYINDSLKRVEDIADAFQQADSSRLSKAAHSLKGSCSNVGAVCLYEMCKEIEIFAKNNQLADAEPLVKGLANELSHVQALFAELAVKD